VIYSSQLHINRLRFSVHIGYSAEERATPQSVEITVHLNFPKGNQASITDKLEDTICYFKLTQSLKEICELKEYHLIEHLGGMCLEKLKKETKNEIQVRVEINKLNPPIPELEGGVAFICGDIF